MKVFTSIPTSKPATPLLDRVKSPKDMTNMSAEELAALADDLRAYLLYAVGQTGGHFGAGLGVIELTVALHHVLNTPDDRLVWDVGHRAYPHKILTGRGHMMSTLRQKDGLAAFPSRFESEYDTFGVGHSSTSISAALGMAIASGLNQSNRKHVAVIGDGAITAGMAMEALSHAGDVKANMLVILNDNQMSISESVGGLSSYLSRIWASKTYMHLREGSKKVLGSHPTALNIARKTEEHVKGLVSPGTFFEELGFNYIGPIDGHDLEKLTHYIDKMTTLEGPQLLHIVTKKGKGFSPAEQDPIGYHALSKMEPKKDNADKPASDAPTPKKKKKYSDVFGEWICDEAARDEKLIGITPAMREGSNLIAFSQQYPSRYFDVAIAEQHAVTLAAGMACEGHKPVVAIYSTFLQRGYDQLIHDVALQKLDVLFAIDRAGLVGNDGATHNGSYDISFLRCIPEMVIMTPSDENECRQMLHTGYQYQGPAAVRYPRGTGTGADTQKAMTALEIGKARKVRDGEKVALLAFGPLLASAQLAAETLNATLIDMRFVKPIDTEMLATLLQEHDAFVTLEENAVAGGAGSAVLEWMHEQTKLVPLLQIGYPDLFIEQGDVPELYEDINLHAEGILIQIQNFLNARGLLASKSSPTETQKAKASVSAK